MLGISESSVKRHVEGRLLHPITDEKGWHLFPADKIEEIRESFEVTRVRRTTSSTPGSAQARHEVAPEIFVSVLEHLDAGKHVVEIAKLMKLLPSQLDPIHRWWVEKRGGYVVTAEMAEEIHGHLSMFAKNMSEGRALKSNPSSVIEMIDRLTHKVQILESETLEKGKCTACRVKKASYCPRCAQNRLRGGDDGEQK
jgi:hypothetical protein